jgi:hypothetical protein
MPQLAPPKVVAHSQRTHTSWTASTLDSQICRRKLLYLCGLGQKRSKGKHCKMLQRQTPCNVHGILRQQPSPTRVSAACCCCCCCCQPSESGRCCEHTLIVMRLDAANTHHATHTPKHSLPQPPSNGPTQKHPLHQNCTQKMHSKRLSSADQPSNYTSLMNPAKDWQRCKSQSFFFLFCLLALSHTRISALAG